MITKKTQMLMTIFIVIIVSLLTAADKYAVLITGDYADGRCNIEGSWIRDNNITTDRSICEFFWNDTYLMWEMIYTNLCQLQLE